MTDVVPRGVRYQPWIEIELGEKVAKVVSKSGQKLTKKVENPILFSLLPTAAASGNTISCNEGGRSEGRTLCSWMSHWGEAWPSEAGAS